VYTEYRKKCVGPMHRIINNYHIQIMHGRNCPTSLTHDGELDCAGLCKCFGSNSNSLKARLAVFPYYVALKT
jgi:hypothetical protein